MPRHALQWRLSGSLPPDLQVARERLQLVLRQQRGTQPGGPIVDLALLQVRMLRPRVRMLCPALVLRFGGVFPDYNLTI